MTRMSPALSVQEEKGQALARADISPTTEPQLRLVDSTDLPEFSRTGLRDSAPPHWGYFAGKRLIDIVGAIGIGTLFLPLFLLLTLFISSDGGNVIYSQTRIGFRGRNFKIYKFRTMVLNADEALENLLTVCPKSQTEWQADQKLKNDPRITRLGKFLRQTSLDELPQLINVLKGEMSLVGPRPIVLDEIAKYGRWAGVYLQVKPGLTGLWQIKGRNDVRYSRRIAMDRKYVVSRGLWMEIMIMMRTPLVMILKAGH